MLVSFGRGCRVLSIRRIILEDGLVFGEVGDTFFLFISSFVSRYIFQNEVYAYQGIGEDCLCQLGIGNNLEVFQNWYGLMLVFCGVVLQRNIVNYLQ